MEKDRIQELIDKKVEESIKMGLMRRNKEGLALLTAYGLSQYRLREKLLQTFRELEK